jgi:hypothetical protein
MVPFLFLNHSTDTSIAGVLLSISTSPITERIVLLNSKISHCSTHKELNLAELYMLWFPCFSGLNILIMLQIMK